MPSSSRTMQLKQLQFTDDDDGVDSYYDYAAINSPPQGLVQHLATSPRTPIFNNIHFGYNTFDAAVNHSVNDTDNDDTTQQAEMNPIYSRCNTKKDTEYQYNQHIYYYDDDEEDYEEGDELLYTAFSRRYRQFCFSSIGIIFTIFLNILMVLLSTFLIIYECILMVKRYLKAILCLSTCVTTTTTNMLHSDSFSTYYNLQLPRIYYWFDILLTLILFIEISAHLTAIYKCHICNYFKYNNQHKIDILVFLLSLFLLLLYVGDVFNLSVMDNISFLMLRVVRDCMRFIRCIIFTKFLYDSIVHLKSPNKKNRKDVLSQSSSCSSGWSHLKNDKQHQFVLL